MRKTRGEKLRSAFKLDENSALFNRDLRNAWEHFDEQLDIKHECLALLNQKYFYKPIWLEVVRVFELANQFYKNGVRLSTS